MGSKGFVEGDCHTALSLQSQNNSDTSLRGENRRSNLTIGGEMREVGRENLRRAL